VFIARDGRHELTTTILTADQVRDLVERMLKTSRLRRTCGWDRCTHRGRPEREVATEEQDPGDVDQAREEGEARKGADSSQETTRGEPAGQNARPPSGHADFNEDELL
jgi:hypothetical protein